MQTDNSTHDVVTEMPPAKFWLRAGAYMLDGFILGIPFLAIVRLLALSPAARGIANFVASAFYFTVFLVVHEGQTPGKQIAGLRVVRMDGTPFSYGRAFLRWLSGLLSFIILGIGYLMAAFTFQNRALHDFIADTRVVQDHVISTGRKVFVYIAAFLLPGIAFLGIVAAIMIPQFAKLQHKSQEALTSSSLALLRTDLELYYTDNQTYPKDFSQIVPKSAESIPTTTTSSHPPSAQIQSYSNDVCSPSKEIIGSKLKDTGGWGYVSDPKSACFGQVFVDCTHSKTGGKEWYKY